MRSPAINLVAGLFVWPEAFVLETIASILSGWNTLPSSGIMARSSDSYVDMVAAAHIRGRLMSRASLANRYFELVKRWETIVARSAPDPVKQAECVTLLQQFIEKTARARMRQPNPPLRFYSDMTQLHQLLSPRGNLNEPLVQLAVLPAFRFISGWLDQHRSGGASPEASNSSSRSLGDVVAAVRRIPGPVEE
jgi:hypothetical protein